MKTISFGGFGEPFMNKDIFKMTKHAVHKGMEAITTSNGYLINENMFDDILKFSTLRISIESISDNEQVGHPYNNRMLKVLERLNKYKKLRNTEFKLIINTIVSRENYDKIFGIIKMAAKIGADGIELIHLDTKDNNANGKLSRRKELDLYKKIRKTDFGINVTSLYNEHIGLRKIFYRFHKKCLATYDSMHITMDGDVTPCCFGLPQYKIDNIYKLSLSEIWKGDNFKKFRKNQKTICDGCSLYRWN